MELHGFAHAAHNRADIQQAPALKMLGKLLEKLVFKLLENIADGAVVTVFRLIFASSQISETVMREMGFSDIISTSTFLIFARVLIILKSVFGITLFRSFRSSCPL